MTDQLTRANRKTSKTHELKKSSSSLKDQHPQSRKQPRKGENPVRIPPSSDTCADLKCTNSWICKNSACRASLSADDSFCKRCSCCICHLFDDNKDTSLWLQCTSESGGDACGLSCHIECALQRGKVGVLDLGQMMRLDGIYCCASCGKVSGVLGCWKKQLIMAKDACRVDVLCHRICLSYRLLDGTSRFNELHELVKEAKAKLETEVGPVDGVSAQMARVIVSRLSVAADVQSLCSLAVEKADELMSTNSKSEINSVEEGSLPAACEFVFEEVTSSSIVVLLIELSNSSDNEIMGYKLWYRKTKEGMYSKEPACVFPRDQKRIWISNLQPCTEYCIRLVSYTSNGDFAHSEVKCYTKSIEIIKKAYDSIANIPEKEGSLNGGSCSAKQCHGNSAEIESDSGFKVRDLGRILRFALSQEKCGFESFSGADMEKFFGVPKRVDLESQGRKFPAASRQLDLNVASVPDLNEEFTPVESPRNEGNVCAFGRADDDVHSDEVERKLEEVPAVDSILATCRKGRNREMQDSDSTLTHGSPHNDSGCLDANFEYCVKIIRWLECEGYIKNDFRLKLLTWFSLRSTEQERRVVNTFIQTLLDDPNSLAGQLVDSFSDIVSNKKPRNGLCNEFWH